jgi:hypothetical protein
MKIRLDLFGDESLDDPGVTCDEQRKDAKDEHNIECCLFNLAQEESPGNGYITDVLGTLWEYLHEADINKPDQRA